MGEPMSALSWVVIVGVTVLAVGLSLLAMYLTRDKGDK
jgi:hypothetical protein